MTSTKHLIGLSVIFVSVALPWSAQAANTIEQTPLTAESVVVSGEKEVVERAIVVATTEITDVQIVAEDRYGITLLFNLSNTVGVQSGVVYGVELYTTGAKRTLVDAKVFSPVPLTLGAGETVPVSLTYVAPDFLTGAHELWVTARTKSGMLLALAPAGAVKLHGTGEQVTLSQCVAVVDGTKYPLSAGVDIAPGEALQVQCVAVNNATKPLDVSPQFTTYERSLYGDKVAPRTMSTVLPLVLEPGQQKILAFAVPTVENPQAYDVVLELVTGTGKVVSPKVVVHYVVQGASATIQNAVFDKASYGAGETASVLVSWSLAADDFLGARGAGTAVGPLTMSVVLADGSGAFCAAPTVLTLEGTNPISQLTVPILHLCEKPQLLISLSDAAGTKLSGQAYEYATVTRHEELVAPTERLSGVLPIALGTFLVVVLSTVALLFARKKRPSAPVHFYEPIDSPKASWVSQVTLNSLIFISVLGGTIFLGGVVTPAEAATLQVVSGADTITFTVNLNKATYEVNEQIRVSGGAFVTGCGNAIQSGGLEAVDGLGVTQSIGTFNLDPYSGGSFAMFDKFVAGYVTPGEKVMQVRAYVKEGGVTTSSFGNLPLTVVCPGGSSWNGASCDSAAAAPTAVVSGSGCVINHGQSTCLASISWNITDATVPSVKNVTTNTTYSHNLKGTNEMRTITHGANVVAAYNGVTSLAATTVTGSCAGGSAWNGAMCAADIPEVEVPEDDDEESPTICPSGTVWNGTACVPPVVLSRANLVPAGLSISPGSTFNPMTGVYDALFVQYSISNNGGTNAGAFTNRIKLDMDDNGSFEETIDAPVPGGLLAGADTPVISTYLAAHVPFGMHRVSLKADVFDTVNEGNEFDNEDSFLLTVPVPDPHLSLTAYPVLMRSGQSTTLSWDTNVTFSLHCTVQGPEINHTFNPSLDGPSGTAVVGPLTAKAEFVLTCTEPTLGTTFTDTVTVEVLPAIQET